MEVCLQKKKSVYGLFIDTPFLARVPLLKIENMGSARYIACKRVHRLGSGNIDVGLLGPRTLPWAGSGSNTIQRRFDYD